MNKLKKILDASSRQSESSELFYMKRFTDKLKFEANELQSMTSKQSEGISLRMRKDGKIGFATSTKIEEDIIRHALDSSAFGDNSDFDFVQGKPKTLKDNYLDKSIEAIELYSLVERGDEIINEITSFDKKMTVNVVFQKSMEEVYVLTTSGFDGNYRKNYYGMMVKVELARENDIFEIYKGFSDRESISSESKIISEVLFDIEHGMDVVKIENGRYPVLFTPNALEDLLFSFISGVDGNKVFRKTSPLYSKLGQEIFDSRINIYDDPTWPGGDNYLPFDDEGVEAGRTPLVEKGVLKNFLLDLKNGRKLNMPSTGNALRKNWIFERSYENYPSINPTTIMINDGKTSRDELLGGIKLGLLVKSAPDLSMGNIQNGDFAGTIFNGYKIENGRLAGRVKNTVITGNLYKLLKEQVEEISSDAEYSMSSCSRLPHILFRDVGVTS